MLVPRQFILPRGRTKFQVESVSSKLRNLRRGCSWNLQIVQLPANSNMFEDDSESRKAGACSENILLFAGVDINLVNRLYQADNNYRYSQSLQIQRKPSPIFLTFELALSG